MIKKSTILKKYYHSKRLWCIYEIERMNLEELYVNEHSINIFNSYNQIPEKIQQRMMVIHSSFLRIEE